MLGRRPLASAPLATLNRIQRYAVVSSAGSFAVTGNAAALLDGNRLNSSAGFYALTGVAADLSASFASTINADAGSYVLTGSAAALLDARKIALSAGAYTIAGKSANLLFHHASAIVPGVYSVTGFDSGLLAGYQIRLNTGDYSLAGFDLAPLALHFVVGPAALDLSGEYVDLRKAWSGQLRAVHFDVYAPPSAAFEITTPAIHEFDAQQAEFPVLAAMRGSNIAMTVRPDEHS